MESKLNSVKYLLAVGVTMLMTGWATVALAFIGGCDEWGCGMNHNETLLRDRR